MAKISCPVNCDNSPNMALLRDFEIAFANPNEEFISKAIADDFCWELVGDQVITGKARAVPIIKGMLDGSIEELTIDNIVTHGTSGAVNGTMIFSNGDQVGFCDVVTFSSHAKNAKIKSLTSYVIAKR
jgi:hypothetical protein